MKQFPNTIPIYNDRNKAAEKKEDLALDLFTLPLISKYRLFQFSGKTDNSLLTGNFDPLDVQGKIIVVKGIKIVPYCEVATQDFFITDGVTLNQETIPAQARMNRIFDMYDYGCQFSLFLNGSRVPIFPTEVVIVPPFADGNVPLDLDLDNIYYKYPEKLTAPAIQMRLDARSFSSLSGSAIVVPVVKVFLQCYLL